MRLKHFRTLLVTTSICIFIAHNVFALKDPTRPPFAKDPETGQVMSSTLTGIIYSKNSKIATIDGKALRVGEKVNNMIVLKIEPLDVVVKNTLSGRVETLSLVDDIGIKRSKER
mgnify:CR=1 FL=1|jgi:hypothetical protein